MVLEIGIISRMLIQFLLLVALLAIAVNGNIIDFTDENFHKLIYENDKKFYLVEFFAPWCGHCKKLEPILKELDKEIGVMNVERVHDIEYMEVAIGKMDATRHTVIPKEYSISSYPTIMYYKYDHHHKLIYGKFEGPRTKNGILTFINKMILPPYIAVDSMTELAPHYDIHPVIFILKVPKDEDSSATDASIQAVKAMFNIVAANYQAYTFFAVLYNTNEGGMKLVKSEIFAGKSVTMDITKDTTVDSIEVFVQQHNRQLVTVFDNHNFKNLGSLNKIMVVYIVEGDPAVVANARSKAALDVAAHSQSLDDQHKFVFGLLDGITHKKFVRLYPEATIRSLLILDLQNEMFHVSNSDDIKGVIQQYLTGEIVLQKVPVLGLYERLVIKIKSNYPYSLLGLVPIILVLISFFVIKNPNLENKKKK